MSSTTPARECCCSMMPSPKPSSRLRTRLPSVVGRYVVTDAAADRATQSYEALIAAGRKRATFHAGRSLRLLLSGLYIGHDGLSEGVRQSTSRVRRLPAQDCNDLRHNRRRPGTGRRALVPRSAGAIRFVADFPGRHRHRDQRHFARERLPNDRSNPGNLDLHGANHVGLDGRQ